MADRSNFNWNIPPSSQDPALVAEYLYRKHGIPQSVIQDLLIKEGFLAKVQQDGANVVNGKNVPLYSGGYGHQLSPDELKNLPPGTAVTPQMALDWFEKDLNRKWATAGQKAQDLGHPSLQEVMLMMDYQLGPHWYKEHPSTWGHMVAGRWPDAIREMQDSDWYYGNDRAPATPTRVRAVQQRIAELMGLDWKQIEPTLPAHDAPRMRYDPVKGFYPY